MTSKKTTTIGLILGLITVLWGALQPMLDSGTKDLKVIIPALVIAGVLYLEKEGGSWETTLVFSILAALGAGASVLIQNSTASWIAVLGAAVVAFAGKLMADHSVVSKAAASGQASSAPETGFPFAQGASSNP